MTGGRKKDGGAKHSFGDQLIRNIEEGIEALRTGKPLRSFQIAHPPQPRPYDHAKLIKLRRRMGWSQTGLALWLNVSNKTVQSWEQGTRKPAGSALRLLQILEKPEVLNNLASDLK